ncbi:MAG: AsnC family transcriptional regulator [Candidatus Aenigmarchaeota archaeon]|nr:AsnC family transcriptional regulator [Candidatus Aenigmarchaeota archaeon]
MQELGKTDLKLLAELEIDSRQTLSKLARKLNTSQQFISYRIQSLEKRGIIGGYYTLIDIAKLGYTSYRTMITLSHFDDKIYREIISYLMKHSNVLWLVECGGRWDMIVNFMAKNIIRYNEILLGFRNKFPKQIQNYDVLTTVEAAHFGRDYFTQRVRKAGKMPYFGREFKILSLDKTDLKILNAVSENARISSVEIARKIEISPNTVILRVKEMKKSGIIQSFKPLIHLEYTPYSSYKALIKFHNIVQNKEMELINYLITNVNIVGIIKLIGLWDFEIEFEVENKDHMIQITRNIRDKFKDVIKEFEVLPLFHEYRYNFFPRDLLHTTSS